MSHYKDAACWSEVEQEVLVEKMTELMDGALSTATVTAVSCIILILSIILIGLLLGGHYWLQKLFATYQKKRIEKQQLQALKFTRMERTIDHPPHESSSTSSDEN